MENQNHQNLIGQMLRNENGIYTCACCLGDFSV